VAGKDQIAAIESYGAIDRNGSNSAYQRQIPLKQIFEVVRLSP